MVAAELTPSRRDLVVWCHVAPQAGDFDSFGYFSVHVSGSLTAPPVILRLAKVGGGLL